MGHAESRAAPVAAPARNEELEREIDSRLSSELKFFGFKNVRARRPAAFVCVCACVRASVAC
jgi:hypothetical protein